LQLIFKLLIKLNLVTVTYRKNANKQGSSTKSKCKSNAYNIKKSNANTNNNILLSSILLHLKFEFGP